MVRSLTFLAAVALAAIAAQADDVDKAEQKLVKAREAYSSAMTEIRDDVLKQIDAKDAAERKKTNPDLTKLKAIKAERDALQLEGELPKWVDVKIKDRITTARGPLVAALTEAKAAYVRAKDDEKAATIDKELEQVKRGVSAGSPKGWQATFPAGKYNATYARGAFATIELKPDNTFFRVRGKRNLETKGRIEFVGGKMVLKCEEFVEIWSAVDAKIKLEHWSPVAKYPTQPPQELGEATPAK